MCERERGYHVVRLLDDSECAETLGHIVRKVYWHIPVLGFRFLGFRLRSHSPKSTLAHTCSMISVSVFGFRFWVLGFRFWVGGGRGGSVWCVGFGV